MKRRQFIPAMVGGIAGVATLHHLTRPANATILNDLFDSFSSAPSAPTAPSAPINTGVDSIFSEVYGANYINRQQLEWLNSGQATHWYQLAPKPYARVASNDGYEHYYFPFNFGDGGVITVCDGSGAIVSWDISTDALVPAFSPADMTGYNYYPPKTEAVAAVPAQPTGYPPLPKQPPPLGCY